MRVEFNGRGFDNADVQVVTNYTTTVGRAGATHRIPAFVNTSLEIIYTNTSDCKYFDSWIHDVTAAMISPRRISYRRDGEVFNNSGELVGHIIGCYPANMTTSVKPGVKNTVTLNCDHYSMLLSKSAIEGFKIKPRRARFTDNVKPIKIKYGN